MYFAVPADHSVKIKENKEKDNYLDLASELRKLWDLWGTVILIVIGALGTIPKEFERRLEELAIGRQIETTQITALLRSARILRSITETWEDLLSLRLQWNIPS